MSEVNQLSRRSFLRLAGGAVGLAALAACTPAMAPSGEGGAPAGATSINFWMWNTYAPEADDVLEQGILAWGEENGINIEISRDSDSDMASKLMPAVEAGTLPDAFFTDAASGAHGDGSRRPGRYHAISGNPSARRTRAGCRACKEYVTRDGVDPLHALFHRHAHGALSARISSKKPGITVPEGQWTWDETRDLCVQAQQFTEESGDTKVGWGFGVVKVQHDGWCEDLFRNFGADIWDETGQNIILAEQSSEAGCTRA